MSDNDRKLLISLREISREEFETTAQIGAVLKDEEGTILYKFDGDVIRFANDEAAILVPAEIAREVVDAYCYARGSCVENKGAFLLGKCPLANEDGTACTVFDVSQLTAEELKIAMLKIALGTMKNRKELHHDKQ